MIQRNAKLVFFRVNESVNCSSFVTETGVEEYHLICSSNQSSAFSDSLGGLKEAIDNAYTALNISSDTLMFSRVYYSDIANQYEAAQNSPLAGILKHGAVSNIEQPPLEKGPVWVYCYHVKSPHGFRKELISKQDFCRGNHLFASGKNISMLWTGDCQNESAFDSASQTEKILKCHYQNLVSHKLNMLTHAVRTWIYVRDIDNHYAGMVIRRKEFFADHGLTEKTRYLASTGIEGRSYCHKCLVSMDSLSYGGLEPGQIEKIEAPGNLSRTIDYGVTFERGLAVKFGDRSHLHISGTASIDDKGKVLFPGDAKSQTVRAIENIQALLNSQNAGLNHLSHIIVYLRDEKAFSVVKEVVVDRFPSSIPMIFVKGPVCRPQWLVEIEGVGLISARSSFANFY